MPNRKYPFSNNKDGFTLIEVLIAMAILAIGMMAVISMQLSAARNNAKGNLITQATLLAKQKMEQLKSVGSVTTLTDGSESDIDQSGQSGGIFDRSWIITNPLGGSATRQLAVTVEWAYRGVSSSVVLRSITEGSGI